MKVFLDTNIILDLLLERDGYEASAHLFQLQDEGRLELCVSVLTMVNVAYVYKKFVGQDAMIPNLKYLSLLVKILPMDSDTIQHSLYLDGKDYEDILQYTCAIQNSCDALITRNEKDFKIREGLKEPSGQIPVYSPSAFTRTLSTNPA